MAHLIQPSGVITRVSPQKGQRFTLAELQGFVSGYIERVHLNTQSGSLDLLVNEEFLSLDLPFNPNASILVGIKIHGTALLLARKEWN